jgi:hypothetical protein
MSTKALTVDAAIADGTTYVSSATAGLIKASLASDFDEGDIVRFESTNDAAVIQVCDSDEAVIGYVQPQRSAVAVLRADSTWELLPLAAAPATLVADGSDATTTQTLANALKTILVNCGLMKAE